MSPARQDQCHAVGGPRRKPAAAFCAIWPGPRGRSGPQPLRGKTKAMRLWLEESDKQVWHRITRKEGRMHHHAACGWHLSPFTGRIWPQKASEPGPPEAPHCRSCVDNQ